MGGGVSFNLQAWLHLHVLHMQNNHNILNLDWINHSMWNFGHPLQAVAVITQINWACDANYDIVLNTKDETRPRYLTPVRQPAQE